ncbi:MAG: GNAT family N-acetyltransferase [Sporichthyaceae bacterium]|nr:GNAT family N-acetyltransferase [Sporichthyaceae bacterium]
MTEPQVPDGVRIDEAVPVVLRELPGWIVDGNEPLVRALIEAGARRRRQASVMMYDLVESPPPADWAEPPLPPGLSYTPIGDEMEAMYRAYVDAYPPGHPDSHGDKVRHEFETELLPLIRGEHLGPMLPASGWVVDEAVPGTAVAVVVINDWPDEGPWVSEVFRIPDPRYAGIGTALLRRALWQAAEAGLRTVGLAVTTGNPAERVYTKIGFQVTSTALNCVIPG